MIKAPLALLLLIAARPDAASRYQLKCLYCHSQTVVEERKRSIPEWRSVLEKMRHKAPLLISREDTRVLLPYLVGDLGLGVRAHRKPAPPAVAPPAVAEATPPPAPMPDAGPPAAPEPEPEVAEEPAPTVPPLVEPPVDAEAQALGPALLEEKCSKCHALNRVFTKVDSVERGINTIERMRRKTGSGITREDAELLERYLRSQL